jgi:hypothetical protein
MAIKVNQAIQTEQGTVTFNGELSQEELDYVLSAGLNYLLQSGALPFQILDEEDEANYLPGTGTVND